MSGGRAIENRKLYDGRRHIWRVGVGGFSTRQLYREGTRIPQGTVRGIPGAVRRTRWGYTTNSTAPQRWANPSSIEFVYTTVGYSQAICGVARIEGTRAGSTLTMDQPCFRWLSKNYTYNEADPTSPLKLPRASPLTNSRSFLTKPHTWAIDRSTPRRHYIYYRSAAGENPNALHLPRRSCRPSSRAQARGGLRCTTSRSGASASTTPRGSRPIVPRDSSRSSATTTSTADRRVAASPRRA